MTNTVQTSSKCLLVPSVIFGIKSDIRFNIMFLEKNKLLYPSGHNIVVLNLNDKSQTLIPAIEGSEGITAICLSPSKAYLAVAERAIQAIITIYDTTNFRMKKRITTSENDVKQYISMEFCPTNEKQFLITLGESEKDGQKETFIFYWQWDKSKCLAHITLGKKYVSYQCSFQPNDSNSLLVTGNNLFRIFRLQENGIKGVKQQIEKKEQSISTNYLTHAWVEGKCLICTDKGDILIVDSNGECKSKLITNETGISIDSILCFSKGIITGGACGLLELYEKMSEDPKQPFRKVSKDSQSLLQISKQSGMKEIGNCIIRGLAIQPDSDDTVLFLSTDNGQLLKTNINLEQPEQMTFEYVLYAFHTSTVTGLDVCIKKPFIASCSSDKSVRVWNYKSKQLEICEFFEEEAYALAFHPSGYHLVVGFNDKIRLLNVISQKLATFREIQQKGCKEILFSHGGHMFAAASGQTIHVYNFYSNEPTPRYVLKGHVSKISSLSWLDDDSGLVSSGFNGVIYSWLLKDQKHMDIFEEKGIIIYSSFNVPDKSDKPDKHIYYGVGSDKQIKEIITDQLQKPKEKKAYEAGCVFSQILLNNGNFCMLCGVGESQKPGSIRAYVFPITGEYSETQAHAGPVTRIRISSNDQYVFSSGSDGTIEVFELRNKDGKMIFKDKEELAITFDEDILTNKSDLDKLNKENNEKEAEYKAIRAKNAQTILEFKQKKNKEINELLQQIEKLKKDTEEKEKNLNDQKSEILMNHDTKINNFQEQFMKECDDEKKRSQHKIDEEKSRYQDLLQQKAEEEKDFQDELAKNESQHAKYLDKLREDFRKSSEEESIRTVQLTEKIDEIKDLHQKTRDKLEEDAEEKINKKKIENSIEIAKITDLGTQSRGSLQQVTKKLTDKQQALEELRKELNKQKEDLETQKQANKQVKQEIKNQENEIDERGKTIEEKRNRKQELKKKTQELEKFRFVLDYKIKELKGDIDPREQEIQKLKEQTAKMDQELKHFRRVNDSLQLIVEDLRMRQDGMDKEIQTQNDLILEDEKFFKKFSEDVSDCYQVQGAGNADLKQLKEAVLILHRKYIKEELKNEVSEADQQKEYANQRKYLENTVNSLKKKLHTDSDAHRKDNIKLMKENAFLIQQINELTNEIRYFEVQSKQESLLNKIDKRERLNTAQSKSEAGSSNKKKLTQKEIEMQRINLVQIQEEIQKLKEKNEILKAKRNPPIELPKMRELYPQFEEKNLEDSPEAKQDEEKSESKS